MSEIGHTPSSEISVSATTHPGKDAEVETPQTILNSPENTAPQKNKNQTELSSLEVKPLSNEKAKKIIEYHKSPPLTPEIMPDPSALKDPDHAKIFDKPEEDPQFFSVLQKISTTLESKIKDWQEKNPGLVMSDEEKNNILESVSFVEWNHFLNNYPEKVEAYKNSPEIQLALEKKKAESKKVYQSFSEDPAVILLEDQSKKRGESLYEEFSEQVGKLDQQMNQLKEKRIASIIHELEMEWLSKNWKEEWGPINPDFFRNEEARDSVEKQALFQQADEFRFDRAGNGAGSVSARAEQLLIEKFPEYLEKSKELNDFVQEVRVQKLDEFVQRYPEKAEAYKEMPGIKEALERKLMREVEIEKKVLLEMGYSESEIQALMEKNPKLAENEKSVFLVLQNIFRSPELTQNNPESEALVESMLSIYANKLEEIFRRRINENKPIEQKMTVDETKNADLLVLLQELPDDNPRSAELKKRFVEMMQTTVQKSATQEQEGHTDPTEDSGEQDEEPPGSEQLNRVVKSPVFKNLMEWSRVVSGKKEPKNLLQMLLVKSGKASDSVEKVFKDVDVGEFSDWMLAGGGWSGGEQGEAHEKREAEGSQEVSSDEIRQYTSGILETEVSLVLQGLYATEMYNSLAKELFQLSPQEVIADPRFVSALQIHEGPGFDLYSQAIVTTIRKEKGYAGLSEGARIYLQTLPDRFLARKE